VKAPTQSQKQALYACHCTALNEDATMLLNVTLRYILAISADQLNSTDVAFALH
jgi:hypothetical protein